MLGNVLLEKEIITETQLNEALKIQVKDKDLLGQILVKLGHCLEEDITISLAEVYNVSYIELNEAYIEPQAIQSIPANLACRYNIVPVKIESNNLHLACSKPLEPRVISNLHRLTNRQIIPYIAADSIISSLLKRHYITDAAFSTAVLTEGTANQSVIKILNNYILTASTRGASDIHFEPQKDRLRVRFRIDGVLNEVNFLAIEMALFLVSRIKILSGLDIAEKRAPQDGSFVFKKADESLDIRVSIFPSINGEKAVLRLLPSKKRIITLESLGMEKDILKRFKSLIKRPHGIILITGPTGSGKSTTLYASLLLMRSAGINITTIEDPVEYRIDGITQAQVDNVNKITFARALRHMVRQDPDIIMIGEIRDKETADIALQAALTGHLVLSTLHTNDAPSALTRLVDMGCEPYLVSSTVCGIVAQRLIRLNCEFCKKPFSLAQEKANNFNFKDLRPNARWFRGQGCHRCQKTGFKGRTGIFELLKIDSSIQHEIVNRSSAERIKEIAISRGMRTLRQDGHLKLTRGVTTPEEVQRVTVFD